LRQIVLVLAHCCPIHCTPVNLRHCCQHQRSRLESKKREAERVKKVISRGQRMTKTTEISLGTRIVGPPMTDHQGPMIDCRAEITMDVDKAQENGQTPIADLSSEMETGPWTSQLVGSRHPHMEEARNMVVQNCRLRRDQS